MASLFKGFSNTRFPYSGSDLAQTGRNVSIGLGELAATLQKDKQLEQQQQESTATQIFREQQLKQQQESDAARQSILNRQVQLQEGEAQSKLAQAEAAGRLAVAPTMKTVDQTSRVPVQGFDQDAYRAARETDIAQGLGLDSQFRLVDGKIELVQQPNVARFGTPTNVQDIDQSYVDVGGTTTTPSRLQPGTVPDIVSRRLPVLPVSNQTPTISSTQRPIGSTPVDARWDILNRPLPQPVEESTPVVNRQELLQRQEALQSAYDKALSGLDKEVADKGFRTVSTKTQAALTPDETKASFGRVAEELLKDAKTPAERAGIQAALAKRVDDYDKAIASVKPVGTKDYFVDGKYMPLTDREASIYAASGKVDILPANVYAKQLSAKGGNKSKDSQSKAWSTLKDRVKEYGSTDAPKALDNLTIMQSAGVQPDVAEDIIRRVEASTRFDNSLDIEDLDGEGMPKIVNPDTGKLIGVGEAIETARDKGMILTIGPSGGYQLVKTAANK